MANVSETVEEEQVVSNHLFSLKFAQAMIHEARHAIAAHVLSVKMEHVLVNLVTRGEAHVIVQRLLADPRCRR